MDYIEGLAKQASQITMYDVKSYYNQARNAVLNVSEMEAKVREATNDDPWGASSTLMQQIADGTGNYAQFNEIMPCIYARFMEKEAREWRQIYKALTLLEFLVKNGSERVVDDARAHISTIKMLRSFHYIDEKGKDQGINVRNRAAEISSLLADVERIRTERRKSKANKAKYKGVGNDGASFTTAGGSRYGGFGSESGFAGGGGGGGGGGGRDYDGNDEYRPSRSSFRDTQAAQPEYDEYEGADDFEGDVPSRRSGATSATSRSSNTKPAPPPKARAKVPEKPVEKLKEVNLFDFGEDEALAPASSSAPIIGGDDDFDDFQQAPSAPTPTGSAPPPKPAANSTNLFDLLGSTNANSPMSAKPNAPPILASPVQSKPPHYTSFTQTNQAQPAMTSRPSYTSAPAPNPAPAASKTASSTFDDLWTTSLKSNGSGVTARPTGGVVGGKSIRDLEKEKAMDKLWGTSGSGSAFGGGPGGTQPAKPSGGGGGGGFDDLLL